MLSTLDSTQGTLSSAEAPFSEQQRRRKQERGERWEELSLSSLPSVPCALYFFLSSQPPRDFSQACSQDVTVGGLSGGESPGYTFVMQVTHLKLTPYLKRWDFV